MKLWPKRPELLQYFKAYYAVNMARLLCRYLPPTAVFVMLLPVAMGDMSLIAKLFSLCIVYCIVTYSGISDAWQLCRQIFTAIISTVV